MQSSLILIALALAQASAAPPETDEEAYLVEDPFDLSVDEGPVPEEAVQAVGTAAAETPARSSSERLICRSRPELNTRTRWLRVCMTAAQWEHHRTNMEQQRRDINDWGAQGGATVGD